MYNLTVIIPHYESVETLKNLLHTIPSSKDIQVIVVDDHSIKAKASFQELASEHQNERVVFVENRHGKGAGGCRNTGLDLAEGKWLLFADDDDFFTKNFYDKVSQYFETNLEVVFFTPTSMELETGELTERHEEYAKLTKQALKNPSKLNDLNLRYKYMVPWSKLISRRFIEEHQIKFEEVMSSNDVMFSTLVGYWLQNYHVSDEVIYCVTKSAGSLITTVSEASYFTRLKVFITYYKFLKTNLDKASFALLDLSGLTSIITAIKYKLPSKAILKALYLLSSNRVTLVKGKYVNPMFVLNKVKFYLKEYANEKDYHTK